LLKKETIVSCNTCVATRSRVQQLVEKGLPLVCGDFTRSQVMPFEFLCEACRPVIKAAINTPNPNQSHSNGSVSSTASLSPQLQAQAPTPVFFFSHRGPDTKDLLIRPISHMLLMMKVGHFFDQDEQALGLQTGLRNDEQMAWHAWHCPVGVVIFSKSYCNSRWCLKELNTFLVRMAMAKDLQDEEKRFVLFPVFYEEDQFDALKPILNVANLGSLSSVLKKHSHRLNDFVTRQLVPDLLKHVKEQQQRACSEHKEDRDDLVNELEECWNHYIDTNQEKRIKLPDDIQPSVCVRNLIYIRNWFFFC
jgi:hypothetical protein